MSGWDLSGRRRHELPPPHDDPRTSASASRIASRDTRYRWSRIAGSRVTSFGQNGSRMRRPDGLGEGGMDLLGAAEASLFWESGHLSWVGAVALTDGGGVVLKAGPGRASLPACDVVHRH